MRILLIDPKGHDKGLNTGLAYLAASLIKGGHEVKVLDMNNFSFTLNDVFVYVKKFKPEIIGVSVKSFTYTQGTYILRKLSEKYKAIYIAGGTHVILQQEDVLKENKFLDCGFISEAEISLLKFCEAIEDKKSLKTVDGIVFREGNKIIKTQPKLIENLDSLPFPSYDSFVGLKKIDNYPLITSRGCPFNCCYCCVPVIYKRKWRARSPENVIEELEWAKEKYCIHNFKIDDDNFTLDIERAKKICDLLIERKINLRWRCPNGIRADRLDYELLRKMKKAGCEEIAIGIESGCEKVFNAIGKGMRLTQIEETIKQAKRAGIKVTGFFMVGLPFSTFQREIISAEFARSLKLNYVHWSMAVPYPHIRFWEWVKKNGKFIKDYRAGCHYFLDKPVAATFETPDFSAKEKKLAYKIVNLKCFRYGCFFPRNLLELPYLILRYDREAFFTHLIKILEKTPKVLSKFYELIRTI